MAAERKQLPVATWVLSGIAEKISAGVYPVGSLLPSFHSRLVALLDEDLYQSRVMGIGREQVRAAFEDALSRWYEV